MQRMEFITSSRRLVETCEFRKAQLKIFEDKRIPIYWSEITDPLENWQYESGPHASPAIARFLGEMQVLKNRIQSQKEPGAILCFHARIVLYQNLRSLKLFGEDRRFQLCENSVVDKQVNQEFFESLRSRSPIFREIEFLKHSKDNTFSTFTRLVDAVLVVETRYPVILTKLKC